jgi:hypothetical protein
MIPLDQGGGGGWGYQVVNIGERPAEHAVGESRQPALYFRVMWPTPLMSVFVLANISYGKEAIAYSTFDRESSDVLRLNFAPTRILAGGRQLAKRLDLSQEGFSFDATTRVLRIRHLRSGTVRIEGRRSQF